MRIETNALNIALSPAQREYARTRLWIATQAAAGRVVWAGLWFTASEGAGEGPRIECRITAWLRGIGSVSVSQNASDAFDRHRSGGVAARTCASPAPVWEPCTPSRAGQPPKRHQGASQAARTGHAGLARHAFTCGPQKLINRTPSQDSSNPDIGKAGITC